MKDHCCFHQTFIVSRDKSAFHDTVLSPCASTLGVLKRGASLTRSLSPGFIPHLKQAVRWAINRAQIGLLASALFLASGCATNTAMDASNTTVSTASPSSSQVAEQGSTEQPDAEATNASFEAETLFDLIIAEMAGKQNRLDVTLGNYIKQAHRTKSPEIAARAARIAKYMNAHQATLDAAQLWLEQDPNNAEALQLLTVQLIRAGRFIEALQHMEQLLAQDASANFDFLVQHSADIPRRKRQEIIEGLDHILEKHPKNPQIYFTKALLEQQNSNIPGAYKATELALTVDPDYVSAIIFKAQLLHKDNKQEEAAKLLKRATRKHEDHKRLGIVYARVLIEQGKMKEAHRQFEKLVEQFPNDYDLLLSLALISWESDLADQAKGYLNQLIELNYRQDEAYLYLAQIAEAQAETYQAIALYQKIGLGPHFANAQTQIAKLYAQDGALKNAREILAAARNLQPQQAVAYYIAEVELLNEYATPEITEQFYAQTLEKFPNDPNLLYSRAMFYVMQDNLPAMETDLRQILADNPTSPLALNALGYTLADRTDRLEEALDLIEKAIALKPDDPAILDSLGWVYFRLGQNEAALQYLQRAYAQYADHEIAAHLGEVLWVTGKKSEAIRIWKKALEQNPESDVIRETMGRLRP